MVYVYFYIIFLDFRKRHAKDKAPVAADESADESAAVADTREKVVDISKYFLCNSEPRDANPEVEIGAKHTLDAILEAIEKQTSNFSPSTLPSSLEIAREYSNERLLYHINSGSTRDWLSKPTFYRALLLVAKERKERF